MFNNFFVRLDNKPDDWENHLLLFTGFLIDKKLKSTSIRTYISAIKGILLENDIQIDEDRFLLNSLTRACKIKNDVLFKRLPIENDLLHLLIENIRKLYGMQRNQPYLESLYQALFMATYYGLLQIGEAMESPHVILARNTHIGVNKDKLLFILLSSKTHSKGSHPQMVKITHKLLKKEKSKSAGLQ